MTREEIREHWATVVNAVLLAEHNRHDELEELTFRENLTAEEQAHLYCLVIADEMMKSYTDEQLQKIYHD